MKFYHYTDIDRYQMIFEGDNLGILPSGLHPSFVDEENSAVYALPSPVPKSWAENSNFTGVWDFLMGFKGPMLLEIDGSKISSSDIRVGDWGYMAGLYFVDKSSIPKKYIPENLAFDEESQERYSKKSVPELLVFDNVPNEDNEKALSRYMENRITLDSYLIDPGCVSIPEILIPEVVPVAALSVSEKQPMIRELLDKREGVEELIGSLNKIPELKRWYEQSYLPSKELKLKLA